MKKTALHLVLGCSLFANRASAAAITFAPGDYDNDLNTVTGSNASPVYNNVQDSGLFRDVFWWGTAYNGGTKGVTSPDFINAGNSLISNGGSPARAIVGPGPYTALNFTGIRTSGGASFLSIYDTTPQAGIVGPGQNASGQNVFNATGGIQLSADILFAPGNHSVSGGIVALYNEGQDGLALLASNGGGSNPDVQKLSLVFQQGGAPTTLTSISLDPDGGGGSLPILGDTDASPTLGDHWYRIVMGLSVSGDTWTMNGSFFNHSDPANPNSALGTKITDLNFSGSLSDPDLAALHLTNPGEVGLMATTAESFSDGLGAGGTGANPLVDNIGVSITNFQIPTITTPDGGASLVLLGLSVLGTLGLRKKFGSAK